MSALTACMPTWPSWSLSPPAPPEPPAPEPAPPGSLAVVANLGGGYAGDLDGNRPATNLLASHAGVEAAAGIGWRRGARTWLLRALVDYAPQESAMQSFHAGIIGPSLLAWAKVPKIDLPVELELGVGIGGFARSGERAHFGLDTFGAIGVPVRADRTLLAAIRVSDLHSTTDALSAMYPPFGNQQVFAFTLALSWRPN